MNDFQKMVLWALLASSYCSAEVADPPISPIWVTSTQLYETFCSWNVHPGGLFISRVRKGNKLTKIMRASWFVFEEQSCLNLLWSDDQKQEMRQLKYMSFLFVRFLAEWKRMKLIKKMKAARVDCICEAI